MAGTELAHAGARVAVSETRVLMKGDAALRSHRALRRELCFTRLGAGAFTLLCTAVSLLFFSQHLAACKVRSRAPESAPCSCPKCSETSQFRALADGGSKEPYQAFLKIACKHPPSAHDTLLMWEQNKLFGFSLSSDSATLIVPSAGMYRIALQVTYRGTDQVSSSKQMILEHHLAVLSDSYQQDRTMLSAFETVYSENTNWRKSLYSEGIFNFQKGDGLKVKTSNLRLVDCDGNVGTKTFLTAYPLAVA
ncbi:hypothetical protein P4O66_017476 [Electrophorus voltai]|uniref:THD domain-containing protein n=1 Tax=Electrophorus voltai TaxID=2609070 RepID=A0AAD9DNQ6_9TELE|nr:hypothetical protein P4O66_017476 [Electrophorus voltai]